MLGNERFRAVLLGSPDPVATRLGSSCNALIGNDKRVVEPYWNDTAGCIQALVALAFGGRAGAEFAQPGMAAMPVCTRERSPISSSVLWMGAR